MKARAVIPVIVLSLLTGAAGTMIAGMVWNSLWHRYSVDRGHESAFLQRYNPTPVIQPFVQQESMTIRFGLGSTPGWRSVSHERTIDPTLAIQADLGGSVMSALSKDIAANLTRDGATILSSSGDPATGFHFAYKVGASVGRITLLPLSDQPQPGNDPPLAPGVKKVGTHITISEKWFSQERNALKASKTL